MQLKLIASLLVLGSTTMANADPAGVWADGGVSYLHPNGNIVSRDCSLWVPARGEGEVSLKCGEWTASTTNFYTTKSEGKTTFSVVFLEIPGAPAGTMALYSGAYVRGNNLALYYGDVYSSNFDVQTYQTTDWTYVGGFKFSKEIESTDDSNEGDDQDGGSDEEDADAS